MLVAFPWSLGHYLFRCKAYFHIIFNLAVLSVAFALYVSDVYINVFDGGHDCQHTHKKRKESGLWPFPFL